MSLPSEFLSAIRDRFPADFATDQSEDLVEYGRDWTRVHEPNASLLVRPRTTDEVAAFVALCHEHQVPVVPSGGRTGLAGGAVAIRKEVVLSLERMRRMDPVDDLARTVRVQAGAVTEAVHRHCEAYGLTWPIDLAAKGSSQIGGNIATNAGGVKVVRYGHTRQWVLGLQVVTAQGEILEINDALEKNNTGIDLRQLFIGSEGILGVVTEATLKLVRPPERLDVFLFAADGLPKVLELFRAARQGPFIISAYEFFTTACLKRVMSHRKVPDPLQGAASHYVLLEVEANQREALEQWMAEVAESDLIQDGTLAQNAGQARALWELREGISESLSATGLPHKNDIALPVRSLDAFCAELQGLFNQRYPDWEICLFGHIGDGNLHVNVMKPDGLDKDTFFQQVRQADDHLFDLVRQHHGSISAEHGIGLLKRRWLDHTRSAEEIALMRTLKQAMDPRNILNPGKVLGD